MLYTNRVKSPYSYMPWSNYEVMQRKRENRIVNVIEKNGAEKLLQTSSILTTILLIFGDMVDVAFDDINRYCKSKRRNRRS